MLLILSNLATLNWPAYARQTDPEPATGVPQATSANLLYLPLMMQQIVPSLGIITTPAELKAVKALSDQGQEPSRSAVIVLMRAVEDALKGFPAQTGEERYRLEVVEALPLADAHDSFISPAPPAARGVHCASSLPRQDCGK